MAEADVAHRTIGQQSFWFSQRERSRSTLDEIAALIDWEPIASLPGRLYPATKGEPAWLPLAMFRAVLLAVWYDLSDVKLADALDDRASFRRFCGFSGPEATPERTAFVRFRRMLVTHDLDRALFDAVTVQLTAKAIRVKAGTIVDATIIASASEDDDDGRWVRDSNRPIHRVRGRVEKIFGTWKRSYGLRRMRWRGLAKAAARIHLTAIAYNLKRTFNLLLATDRRRGGPIASIETAANEPSGKNALSQCHMPTRAQVS